jgi:hypothetical protein
MDRLAERLVRAGHLVDPPQPSMERLLRRRDRRDRNRRFASTFLALAIAAGGTGGALYALSGIAAGPRRVEPGNPPSSVSVPPLAPGETFYEKYVVVIGEEPGIEEGGRVDVETWWATDGSGRLERDTTTPAYGVRPSGTWGPGEFPGLEDISGLSTDPNELAVQLGVRSAPGGASPQPDVTPEPGQTAESGGLWRAVTALMEMPNAEPALRAALFEVAADIPGVEVIRDAQDPVGRDALMLRISSEGADKQLFFDPQTHQLMANVEDYARSPIWYRIVTEAGIVGSTEDRPAPDEAFFPPPADPIPDPEES